VTVALNFVALPGNKIKVSHKLGLPFEEEEYD
jgi:hypothetical protein